MNLLVYCSLFSIIFIILKFLFSIYICTHDIICNSSLSLCSSCRHVGQDQCDTIIKLLKQQWKTLAMYFTLSTILHNYSLTLRTITGKFYLICLIFENTIPCRRKSNGESFEIKCGQIDKNFVRHFVRQPFGKSCPSRIPCSTSQTESLML